MKHRRFPAPQIAAAVFRGKKTPYNFEVYPLNIEFNEVPAVYVISKRKIDRYGKGHHAIVCLGQTTSLAAEMKNQKKVKNVREQEANVVSVLLAESEKSRLAIEADLKATHAIRCLPKPKIKKAAAGRKTNPANIDSRTVGGLKKPTAGNSSTTPVKPENTEKAGMAKPGIIKKAEPSKVRVEEAKSQKTNEAKSNQKFNTVKEKSKAKNSPAPAALAVKPRRGAKQAEISQPKAKAKKQQLILKTEPKANQSAKTSGSKTKNEVGSPKIKSSIKKAEAQKLADLKIKKTKKAEAKVTELKRQTKRRETSPQLKTPVQSTIKESKSKSKAEVKVELKKPKHRIQDLKPKNGVKVSKPQKPSLKTGTEKAQKPSVRLSSKTEILETAKKGLKRSADTVKAKPVKTERKTQTSKSPSTVPETKNANVKKRRQSMPKADSVKPKTSGKTGAGKAPGKRLAF